MMKKILTVLVLALFTVSFYCLSSAGEVKDEPGRKVTVRNNPQRIISLAPGIAETLYALNLDSKTVGVTNLCNLPVRARQKPQIGGFINPSMKKLLPFNPI